MTVTDGKMRASGRSCQVSVVIVNHGHDRYLARCLESVAAHAGDVDVEIILVNNIASPEAHRLAGTMATPLRTIDNARPRGFAANCNAGFRKSRGRYVLFLNPDCYIVDGTLGQFIGDMSRLDRVGVACCRLLNPDHSRQNNVRRFPALGAVLFRGMGLHRMLPPIAAYRHYLMDDIDRWDAPLEIDWCFGAFMLISSELYREIGMLDERFFMYYEDMDLCYRLVRHGRRNYYLPVMQVVHDHRRDSARKIVSRMKIIHFKSMLRFFSKHGYWVSPPDKACRAEQHS